MNLYHELDAFIAYLASERGVSPHTIAAYSTDLMQFIKALEERSAQPDRAGIDVYLEAMRQQGKGTRSVVRSLSALRGFFRFLMDSRKLTKDPMEDMETPRFQPPIPRFLTEGEMVQLLSLPKDTAVSLRDRAVLELLYASGLRVSELVHLKKSDVNLEGGFVLALGKRSKERVVPPELLRERCHQGVRCPCSTQRALSLSQQTGYPFVAPNHLEDHPALRIRHGQGRVVATYHAAHLRHTPA